MRELYRRETVTLHTVTDVNRVSLEPVLGEPCTTVAVLMILEGKNLN